MPEAWQVVGVDTGQLSGDLLWPCIPCDLGGLTLAPMYTMHSKPKLAHTVACTAAERRSGMMTAQFDKLGKSKICQGRWLAFSLLHSCSQSTAALPGLSITMHDWQSASKNALKAAAAQQLCSSSC